MELKVTRYEIDDAGVATVWLHRPERRNSWTARMHTEYRWIMAELEANQDVRVAVLTGSGTTFCVGADAKALDTYVGTKTGFDPGITQDVARPGYGVRREFDADVVWQLGLRFPLICAVNGACAGVAMAMAAFSDIRFGVEGAKVTTATPKLAMPVEYGLSWMLPRLIGVTHAADVLLSGRIVLAEELERMGFFNAVYPADVFHERVSEYAHLLAAHSPEATTVTKRQLYDDLLRNDPAASVDESKQLIGRLMAAPDYAEGVRALIEKRAPRFGRQVRTDGLAT
jgi:enoyl-CoA hydratase/carnithine racemase